MTCSSPDRDLPTGTPMMDTSHANMCDELSQQSAVTSAMSKQRSELTKQGRSSSRNVQLPCDEAKVFCREFVFPAALLYKYAERLRI
jgi:hypothetical protein